MKCIYNCINYGNYPNKNDIDYKFILRDINCSERTLISSSTINKNILYRPMEMLILSSKIDKMTKNILCKNI